MTERGSAAMSSTRAERGAATVARLLDAASTLLCTEGAAAVTIQRVADAAGTSKALVHYHFADKDALLVACAERVTAHLTAAEGSALATSTAETALADLWLGHMSPETCAVRRALLALITDASEATRSALSAAMRRRRLALAGLIGRLEALMSFAPEVHSGTLVAAYTALIDGLTLQRTVDPGDDHRRAFDAFWLAILSLDR
ncbi:MAG TPA: TetR/AcrR family transcriptional regulator [Gemmatimonadaceae bacterium]|nr:TetR/AcrR family transcriptional regulator [Gemmatimonadaceae bacterium]